MAKASKPAIPTGFATKRLFFKPSLTKSWTKPSATTFEAKSQMTRQRFGRFGILSGPSKTQKAAQEALKEVYGNASQFKTQKIAFKQKAYTDAYNAQIAKYNAQIAKTSKILTAAPTKWYQGIAKIQKARAIFSKLIKHFYLYFFIFFFHLVVIKICYIFNKTYYKYYL